MRGGRNRQSPQEDPASALVISIHIHATGATHTLFAADVLDVSTIRTRFAGIGFVGIYHRCAIFFRLRFEMLLEAKVCPRHHRPRCFAIQFGHHLLCFKRRQQDRVKACDKEMRYLLVQVINQIADTPSQALTCPCKAALLLAFGLCDLAHKCVKMVTKASDSSEVTFAKVAVETDTIQGHEGSHTGIEGDKGLPLVLRLDHLARVGNDGEPSTVFTDDSGSFQTSAGDSFGGMEMQSIFQ